MNEILLEYYQGKPKELIKCEGYLREIIADINRDHEHVLNVIRERHVYRDNKSVTALCNELAKFFNVDKVNVFFDAGSINAYTVTTSLFSTASSRRTAFDRGDHITGTFHICVYENVVYDAKLTEQELLAAILHEIGHNFYYCPIGSTFELVYAIVFSPISILIKLLGSAIYRLKDAGTDIFKRYLPVVFNAVELCDNIRFQMEQFFYGPAYFLNVIVQCITTGRIPLPSPLNILSYGDEKGADSFAARYGYGADLITALEKFNTAEGLYVHKARKAMGPFGSLLEDMYSLEIDLLSGLFCDPHPSNVQRANAVCKKLEADLANNDYPPAMKADLQKEINRCKETSERMLDPKYGGDIKVRKVWYDALNKATDGHTDLREIFNVYYDKNRF